MNDQWLDQVTAIIRSGEMVAFPLDRLRDELRERFGWEPPALPELRRLLQSRPDRFLVVEPDPLPALGSAQGGGSELMRVLRSAGLVAPAQVMLRGDAEPATDLEEDAALTRAVSRSLTVLWTARSAAVLGRAELVQATRAANQLRGTLRRLSARPRLPASAPAAGGTRTSGGSAAT